MKPTVLCTLLRGIDRLAEGLLDRMDVELVVLYEEIGPLLDQRGLPYRLLDGFVTNDMRRHAEQELIERGRTVVETLHTPAFRAEWPHYDATAWERLSEHITAVVKEDFFQELVLIDAMRRCAAETDLRLLVVHQDVGRDARTLVHTARQLGVSSLHVMHGFPYGSCNLESKVYADIVAVASDFVRDQYVSVGIPPERVAVTGNFEWDIHCRPPLPEHRETVCERLNLDPHRPIILYAGTFAQRLSAYGHRYPDRSRKHTEAVLDAFALLSERHPDWQFVLRPHPSDLDAPEDVSQLQQASRISAFRMDREIAIAYCLAAADVLACTDSNVGIEAVLAGKPVVNCVVDKFLGDRSCERLGPLFREGDAVLFARRPDEIAPRIEAALTDPAAQQALQNRRLATIQRLNHSPDGKALDRVCALAKDMIERPRNFTRPPDLRPDLQRLLVNRVPEDARNVLIIGSATEDVAGALQQSRSDLAVTLSQHPETTWRSTYDVVIVAVPTSSVAEVEGALSSAEAAIAPRGTLLVPFASREVFILDESHTGIRKRGIEVVLSRHGFVCEDLIDLDAEGDGYLGQVAVAVLRKPRPRPTDEANAKPRAEAVDANAEGETLFAKGDYAGAAAAFAKAVAAWDGTALLHNNLGASLHALGQSDAAYKRFIHALRCDPRNEAARENLRQVAQNCGRAAEAERVLRLFGSDEAMGGAQAD